MSPINDKDLYVVLGEHTIEFNYTDVAGETKISRFNYIDTIERTETKTKNKDNFLVLKRTNKALFWFLFVEYQKVEISGSRANDFYSVRG